MESILLQEPDAAIAEIVGTVLSMEGYRVYRITGHEENIVALIARYRARVVLLDCWLPRFSGRFCKWIKVNCPDLPVIAFSCDNNIAQHYRSLGFDGYLKKPFELEELYHLVRKYVRAGKKEIVLLPDCTLAAFLTTPGVSCLRPVLTELCDGRYHPFKITYTGFIRKIILHECSGELVNREFNWLIRLSAADQASG